MKNILKKQTEINVNEEMNNNKEEKDYNKTIKYASRFYNALINYSDIGIFLCNSFEDIVFDGLPRKRPRSEIIDIIEVPSESEI